MVYVVYFVVSLEVASVVAEQEVRVRQLEDQGQVLVEIDRHLGELVLSSSNRERSYTAVHPEAQTLH